MTEASLFLALVLGTLAYPFFVEDRITSKTVLWAVLFAAFTPVTTFIYAMNHKEAMLRLRAKRVQRAEREKQRRVSNGS